MKDLMAQINTCELCRTHLSHPPRPVISADSRAKILIISQAPGKKAHESRLPWNDQSGDTLRDWLGVSREQFYDPSLFAILPMGFCYPGKGKSGDLPPRRECAPQWHARILRKLEHIELTLLIGSYSQAYYLRDRTFSTLTETVKHYRDYLPRYFPLVHPSPRNEFWQMKNPWFGEGIIPVLRDRIHSILPSWT